MCQMIQVAVGFSRLKKKKLLGKLIKWTEPKLPLQSPFVSIAVTDAGVEDREVVAEVFSRAGLGTPSRLLAAAADRPVGRASGLLWPCRPWPQIRWCLSQSLCWQKEPQYRAMLQPLHVSLALRPQFQQLCKTKDTTL